MKEYVDHIDRVCQIAVTRGTPRSGRISTGDMGPSQCPGDLDTIADLQVVAPLLRDRGYAEADVEAIMHGNWLRLLEKSWTGCSRPSSSEATVNRRRRRRSRASWRSWAKSRRTSIRAAVSPRSSSASWRSFSERSRDVLPDRDAGQQPGDLKLCAGRPRAIVQASGHIYNDTGDGLSRLCGIRWRHSVTVGDVLSGRGPPPSWSAPRRGAS